MKNFKIGIIGISGYTGLELIKILLNHPNFTLIYLANTSGDSKLWHIHPSLNSVAFNADIAALDFKKIKQCELIFLALPHEESMKIAPKILDLGIKVVDLSADYRLKKKHYEKFYSPHLDSKNLKSAVYGLIEWNKKNIKKANLIANPGCYPTASLLGILPFIEFLGDSSIFIDAKSGVSGAGKKLNPNTHFSHINENIFAYSPLAHRHQIEISEKCEAFGARKLKINFIPHLSPFTRGMLVSIFVRLKKEIEPLDVLNRAYKDCEFIRVRNNPVDVKSVAGSHFCDIFALANGRDLWINTAIDNLLRGASSQAVACANLMLGLNENLALPKIAYVP